MSRFVVLMMVSLCCSAQPAEAQFADDTPETGYALVLELHGIRSVRGQVIIGVFDQPSMWLADGAAFRTLRVPATTHRVEIPVPPGRYALALLHDEDSDGSLDRDWIGVPSEGYGFSRDARAAFAPPSFEDAVVSGGHRTLTIRITLRYGI